jgi:hypothetical protein
MDFDQSVAVRPRDVGDAACAAKEEKLLLPRKGAANMGSRSRRVNSFMTTFQVEIVENLNSIVLKAHPASKICPALKNQGDNCCNVYVYVFQRNPT